MLNLIWHINCKDQDMYKNLALLAITSFLVVNTEAFQCKSFFQNITDIHTELPGKGNSFTVRGFNGLTQEHQDLVKSLESALNSLEDAEVTEVLYNINQSIDSYDAVITQTTPPTFLLEEIKNKPFKKAVLENFNLFRFFLDSKYTDQTVAGLSLLYKDVKRSAQHKPIISDDSSTFSNSDLNRLGQIFRNKKYAIAALDFLDHKDSLETVTALLTDLEQSHNWDTQIDVESSIASMKKDLLVPVEAFRKSYSLNKKFSTKHLNNIALRLINLLHLLKVYFEHTANHNLNVTQTEYLDFKDLPRDERLQMLEETILSSHGDLGNLRDIILLIDHIMTGHSLPLDGKAHSALINSSLNSSLVPVRTQISKNRVLRREKEDFLKTSQTPKTHFFSASSPLFVSSDKALSEKRNPNKRKNQSKPEIETLEAESSTETPPKLIDSNLDLKHFTELSKSQRNISELEADHMYQVRFLRDSSDLDAQKVIFSPNVVKSFKADSALAAQFIRALNLGHAIRTHQDGLKVLKATSLDGRLYELKLRKSDQRLILSHNDGTWTALKLTDKSHFDRDILSLGKFHRRSN